MHIADLLSRQSDHYISSGDDNKDQVLLNPVTIKLINITDHTYEERCHAPNTFGTVNMEHTINSRLSWSKR